MNNKTRNSLDTDLVTKYRDFNTIEMNTRTEISPLGSFSSSIRTHQADSHFCGTGLIVLLGSVIARNSFIQVT
jgi:hypothetical protein